MGEMIEYVGDKMNIAGITFGKELMGYVTISALKISKWVDPQDNTLEIIFRLTVEHNYGEEGFKKIKELYVYFREEETESIIIDDNVIEQQRKRLRESEDVRTKEHKLQKEISPLEGYVHPIFTKEVRIETLGKRRRIKIFLEDYEIDESTKIRNIFFSIKYETNIDFSNKTWCYNYFVEPYLIQSLKWDKEEFMPLLKSLEIWLQIPKIKSLSDINIKPVGNLNQLFFLREDVVREFRRAGQHLAQEDTLCINWVFHNLSTSSPPHEMRVTYIPGSHEREEEFVERFKNNPKDTMVILREILYACKIQALDFKYIISGVSDNHLKALLDVFNTSVFQRGLRPMEENLKPLLSSLKHFESLLYCEEFLERYQIFYTLLICKKSEDFFSDHVLSGFRQFEELENLLDPGCIELMQDLAHLSETTRKFNLYNAEDDRLRYKNELIFDIERLYDKWEKELISPDRYILNDILVNWKQVVEKEFEGTVAKPKIEVSIKTKHLVLADNVGVVFSIKNSGDGNARDIHVKLLPADDYDIVSEMSETRAFLTRQGRPFEPELMIKPKNEKEVVIQYEVNYRDIQDRKNKEEYEEIIEFIKKEIEFKKIENPYIIGDVVRDKRMFFGREELLEDIFEIFRGRYQINPIFLYGQRRTGKTSILYHLKERLKNDFSPVNIRVSDISGSFYQNLMERIKNELDFHDIEVPCIEGDAFDVFKNKFYAQVRKRIGGKKLVLMIDEYQLLDLLIAEGRYEDSVIDFLNTLVQDGEIKFILAGYLRPDELQNKKWMDFMRFFTTMNVSFLRREDAIKLICEPVREFMEYDEGAIEKIISLGGCHPYFTQLICHVMVEYHNYEKVNIIGYHDITDHLFEYFERGYTVFTDIVVSQTNETERRILLCLCNLIEKMKKTSIHRSDIELSMGKYEKNINRAEIDRALIHLEKREIIRKSSEHPEYYEFAIDLYRQWVKWNLSRDGGK